MAAKSEEVKYNITITRCSKLEVRKKRVKKNGGCSERVKNSKLIGVMTHITG